MMSWRRMLYNLMYRFGTPRWDTSITPPEVVAVIEGDTAIPSGRALDLGCGSGTNVIYLARHGWEAVGVDFSPVAIAQARQKAKDTQGQPLSKEMSANCRAWASMVRSTLCSISGVITACRPTLARPMPGRWRVSPGQGRSSWSGRLTVSASARILCWSASRKGRVAGWRTGTRCAGGRKTCG